VYRDICSIAATYDISTGFSWCSNPQLFSASSFSGCTARTGHVGLDVAIDLAHLFVELFREAVLAPQFADWAKDKPACSYEKEGESHHFNTRRFRRTKLHWVVRPFV